MSDDNFSGPVYNNSYNVELESGGKLSIPCNDSDSVWGPGVHVPPAYMDFNVQINGVKYMVDSAEIVRNVSLDNAPLGFCHIAISTNTVQGKPDIWLGLPFLRSVYL